MVSPAGVFPFDICDQLAMYVEVDTAYQSPSGKSVGEIRVVLQFTPTVVQAAPGPGTVYSATYGQPYSAPPACEGSAPRAALSHVLFEVDCICFAEGILALRSSIEGAESPPLAGSMFLTSTLDLT